MKVRFFYSPEGDQGTPVLQPGFMESESKIPSLVTEEVKTTELDAAGNPVVPVTPVVESTTTTTEVVENKATEPVVEDKEPEVPNTDPNLFWQETEKITGREVKVEYGDTLPDSPQGAALREAAVREQSMDDFENHLRTTKPVAYAFMLHLDQGGDPEEFFAQKTVFNVPTPEELTASVDLQAKVYKQDLRNMGLDDDAAEALLQKAIKDSKLGEKAKASAERIKTAQQAQLDDIESRNKAEELKLTNAGTTLNTRVTESINNELSIIVPETEKEVFKTYIKDRVQYKSETGQYFLVQELDVTKMKQEIESLFYQFKKGDLSKIIEKKVNTKAAEQLRLRVDQSNKTTNTSIVDNSTKKTHVPLANM